MTTLALIGVGAWGTNYLKTIEEISACRLKYICAQSKKTLNKLSNKYIKFQNYKNLSKYKDIKGIIVATPASTHYRIAKYFLSKGNNLLIEKPLTTSYQEALSLKKIYEKTRSVVLVGHLDQYNPAYLKVRELRKKIGTIYYLDFTGGGFGPFRSDVSVLWDWGPHAISLCLDVIGKEPFKISAWGIKKLRPKSKLYEMVYLHLNFPDNISAFIKISRLSPVKERKLTVVGSSGSLIFDDTASRKIRFFRGRKTFYPSYQKDSPLKRQILEFIECLRINKKPKTDLEHGIKVIKIIQGIQESIIKDGEMVKFS